MLPKDWKVPNNLAGQLLSMFFMPRASGKSVPKPSSKRFPASINRWTGKPHEHRRAIARRLSNNHMLG